MLSPAAHARQRRIGLGLWASALFAACGPGEVDRGTFVPTSSAEWPAFAGRPLALAAGQSGRVGEVTILEGDDGLVSGVSESLGVRFDEARNDLGAIAARLETLVPIAHDATLVLFTSFEDLGAAGPAYAVPVRSTVRGLGRPPFDQRAVFSVDRIVQIVNMKRLDSHDTGELARTFAHELAHLELAFMSARPETSSVALPLYGRQGAHWHAALHSEGSIMGGHAWVETTPGRFLVSDARSRFSRLDLYALGLLEANAVTPFFFIAEARTEGGARIPGAAELVPDMRARGRRIDLSISDVVRALGPREPSRSAPRSAVFVLLTAPGETATSTRVVSLATRIDIARRELEEAWTSLTLGRDRLCTTLAPCFSAPPPLDEPAPAPETPAPETPAPETPAPETPAQRGGCTCVEAHAPRTGLTLVLLALVFERLSRSLGPIARRARSRQARKRRPQTHQDS